ncbi:MAG: hypothetical protein QOE69_2753 [Thermoleophilaceae bacterium]|jgi:hypothetical protein|nr:hypothetical protein [Thermoleophilaceae bacterium]MEA2408634.1 hypothetical protein [Thermoleophilaceae bacterium]
MAAACILASVGCSVGADEEPQPVSGVPKAIVATVDRLERAIAAHDYETVCRDLFTAGARKRAGGSECAAQLSSAGADVKRPQIEIRGIDVKGSRATVKVATEAEGQALVTDTLVLRRERGRWLVEALG